MSKGRYFGLAVLFRHSGRFFRHAEEMFALTSWVQVLLGQRIMPCGYHPLVDSTIPEREVEAFVGKVKEVVAACVDAMPRHEDFIARRCAAPSP